MKWYAAIHLVMRLDRWLPGQPQPSYEQDAIQSGNYWSHPETSGMMAGIRPQLPEVHRVCAGQLR
jgi:hypothetical protein